MSNFDKLTNWRQRQVTASGQRGRKSRGRGQCSLRAASRPPTRDQPDDVQREEEEDGRRRQLCWHAKFDMSYLVANLWLLISGLLVLMSAKVAATTTTKCSRFAALFFANERRKSSTKNCMAKFSLLFLARYWAAFCPLHGSLHPPHPTVPSSVLSKMLFTSPHITYTPRAAAPATATCWDRFAQKPLTHTKPTKQLRIRNPSYEESLPH